MKMELPNFPDNLGSLRGGAGCKRQACCPPPKKGPEGTDTNLRQVAAPKDQHNCFCTLTLQSFFFLVSLFCKFFFCVFFVKLQLHNIFWDSPPHCSKANLRGKATHCSRTKSRNKGPARYGDYNDDSQRENE